MVLYAGLEQWRTIMYMILLYVIIRNTYLKSLVQAFLEKYKNERNEKVPFE